MRKILMIFALVVFCALPVEMSGQTQTSKWRDVYEVKKKDTMYGVAKKYGITIDELILANPEMRSADYKMKKGDFVFIPFAGQMAVKKEPVQVAQPAPAVPAASAKGGDIRKRAINVGVMLPLHKVDGDGKRMTEYYRGLLLAFDELKNRGVSVNVNTWNVPVDADIRVTLTDPAAKNLDIVFGPLYSKQVPALADFCKKNDVKMVIPFSITGGEVAQCDKIYQVYQTPQALNEKAIESFVNTFGPCNVVVIDCNDSTSGKGMFTFGLRKRLEAKGVSCNITNLQSSEAYFTKAFDKSKKNVVVLNTGRSPQLNVAFAKLNNLTFNNPDLNISMFGYTEWLMYTSVYSDLFHKYDVYVPTTFYFNEKNSRTKDLREKYISWFKTDMQYARPQFVVTGYDHAEFFLGGLHEFGSSFSGSRAQSSYLPLQTPLRFVKLSNGGYMNEAFMLIHYKKDMSTDKIEMR